MERERDTVEVHAFHGVVGKVKCMCSAGCQNELSSIGQRTARELMGGEHGVEILGQGVYA